MTLQVSADAVRSLIPDGSYILQLLERRGDQSLVLTLTLASRKMGHTLHIETAEDSVVEFLRRLLATASSPSKTARRSRLPRQRPAATATPQEPARAATAVVAALDAIPVSSVNPRRRSRRGTSRQAPFS